MDIYETVAEAFEKCSERTYSEFVLPEIIEPVKGENLKEALKEELEYLFKRVFVELLPGADDWSWVLEQKGTDGLLMSLLRYINMEAECLFYRLDALVLTFPKEKKDLPEKVQSMCRSIVDMIEKQRIEHLMEGYTFDEFIEEMNLIKKKIRMALDMLKGCVVSHVRDKLEVQRKL